MSDIIKKDKNPLTFFDSFFDFDFPTKKFWSFKLDIIEEKDNYTIKAEVPGATKDKIEISYQNSSLIIDVFKDEEKSVKEKNYIHKEISTQSMRRTLFLPNLNENSLNAKLSDGVLTITASKLKKARENKIEIE